MSTLSGGVGRSERMTAAHQAALRMPKSVHAQPDGRLPRVQIFSVPRAFRGPTALAQTNAIGSWLRAPGIEPGAIALLGDEEGVAEVAREYGMIHLPGIRWSPSGAPLLDSVIQAALELTGNADGLLCYVNADIVLVGNLLAAAKATMALEPFLLVARRVDVELHHLVSFVPGWESELLAMAATNGASRLGAAGSDLLLFNRGLFGSVPPLAIGRCAWDNWMMAEALRKKAALVDATSCLTLIHQRHGYEHAGIDGEGMAALRKLSRSPEGRRNLDLAGGPWALRTVEDATHRLLPTETGPELVRVRRGARMASGVWRLRSTLAYYVAEALVHATKRAAEAPQ
jgi:hypothetical protein